MDLKSLKPLLDKIPVNILLVLFLANLGWDYYNFESSPDSPQELKKAEIKSLEQELEKLRDRVKKADTFRKSLDSKALEIRKLLQDLEATKTGLSEELDVAALIRTVLTEAKKVGLTVVSLRPTQSKTSEYYVEQAFDLQFKGVYFQLVGFLDRISNLQKIVRVDSLSVDRSSSSLARYVEVTGTVQLKAYRYNRSKADELQKAPMTLPGTPAPASAAPAPVKPAGGGGT